MKSYIVFFCLFSVSAFAQNREFREINKALEAIYEVDQSTRNSVRLCEAKFGVSSPECMQVVREVNRLDSVNQELVFQVLDKGWPHSKQISEKANDALFLVLQHAPLEKQIRYAPILKSAFLLGEVSPSKYAIFQDRLNVRQGKLQTYGSQTGADQYGNVFFYPISNFALVDSARQKVGLSSFDQYRHSTPGNRVYVDSSVYQTEERIILIVHIGNKAQQALKGVKLFVKDQVIGETDDTGFMYISLPRENYQELSLRFVANEQNQINYSLKGEREFFDIYLMFNKL